MAEPLQNLSLDQLKTLLKRSFLQQPLGRLGELAYMRGGGDVSPYQAIAGRSSSLDYVRQLLPENLDNTNWYQKLKKQLPDGDLQSTPGVRRRVANQVGQIPLGGFDARDLERMQLDRSVIERGIDDNPSLSKRLNYVDASKFTTEKGLGEIGTSNVSTAGRDISLKGRPAARAAQATGVLARDIMTDGKRNIWWFLNAPQAATQAAALQGIHKSGLRHSKRPMIGNAGLRLAATAPAVVAMSTAIGNIGRPAGYKAILPSEEDPRKTDSPIGELLSRYFLGRTGRLLPYDEFAKERPDVDKGEYMRYKAYQFNKDVDLNPLDGDFNVLGALRGTTDGIHGPEINFMGKAIPVLTGILPTAAAITGIRRGVNTAGLRLAGDIKEVNRLDNILKKKRKKPLSSYNKDRTKAAIQEAQENIDIETFKDALKYGAGYTTAAALTGQALESIRRDMGRED